MAGTPGGKFHISIQRSGSVFVVAFLKEKNYENHKYS